MSIVFLVNDLSSEARRKEEGGGEHLGLCVFADILTSALAPPPARARAPPDVRLDKYMLTDKQIL